MQIGQPISVEIRSRRIYSGFYISYRALVSRLQLLPLLSEATRSLSSWIPSMLKTQKSPSNIHRSEATTSCIFTAPSILFISSLHYMFRSWDSCSEKRVHSKGHDGSMRFLINSISFSRSRSSAEVKNFIIEGQPADGS